MECLSQNKAYYLTSLIHKVIYEVLNRGNVQQSTTTNPKSKRNYRHRSNNSSEIVGCTGSKVGRKNINVIMTSHPPPPIFYNKKLKKVQTNKETPKSDNSNQIKTICVRTNHNYQLLTNKVKVDEQAHNDIHTNTHAHMYFF
jgi:hypothetical protein